MRSAMQSGEHVPTIYTNCGSVNRLDSAPKMTSGSIPGLVELVYPWLNSKNGGHVFRHIPTAVQSILEPRETTPMNNEFMPSSSSIKQPE